MDRVLIAQLLQPFLKAASVLNERGEATESAPAVLSESQLSNISTYIDILLRWNSRINLTSVRDPEEMVTRHFGESLFAARQLFKDSPARDLRGDSVTPALDLLDLGSGAGFPGLPIKILVPNLRTTLIESNHKKVAFLREVIRALTLTDIDVSPSRAQDFPSVAKVVTLRAVERFDEILLAAIRLVAPAGCLALLIGQSQIERAQQGAPELAWHTPVAVPVSQSRVLLVGMRHPPLGDMNQAGQQVG
jgi:16S rRNA (guanine527-N7)-methyltransferase